MPQFLYVYSSLWTLSHDTVGFCKDSRAAALLGKTCADGPYSFSGIETPNQASTCSQSPWPLSALVTVESLSKVQSHHIAHISGHYMARTVINTIRWDISEPSPTTSPSRPIYINLRKLWGVKNCSSSFNQGCSLRCLSTILFKNGQFYIKERRKSTQECTIYQIELVFRATTCKQICLIRTPCFYCILSNFSVMRRK